MTEIGDITVAGETFAVRACPSCVFRLEQLHCFLLLASLAILTSGSMSGLVSGILLSSTVPSALTHVGR